MIDIRPASPALGAVVAGVDLRELDAGSFESIRQAWLENVLLVFHDQSLRPDEIVQVARRFGTPITSSTINKGDLRDAGYFQDHLPPEITSISNLKDAGKSLGLLGDAEVVWHSDHSYSERPAAARMLYGAVVPPVAAGGNTSFMNCYAAYDQLPDGLKRQLSGKTIKHDNAVSITMEWRQGVDPLQSIVDTPGICHPIISTHPETGANSLFLGRRSRAYVNGLSLTDSEALLDLLWAHSTQARFLYEHRWSTGDLVVWDNRCTMHRRGAFDPNARRLLYAAQVEGHRPYEAPDALARASHPRFGQAGAT